jgi:uncharacterized protein (TIGR02611 family)
VAGEETGERSLIERVRARQHRHKQRNRIYRVVFAVAGFIVLLGGLIMLVTPGPGLAVIAVGLAMLAMEFVWAERALERAINQMERAANQVRHGSPAKQAAFVAAGVLGLAAFVGIIVFWDVPILPG